MTDSLTTTLLPSYTESSILAFQTVFASLSLQKDDRLRFLSFPPEAIDACRQIITAKWFMGIQEERPLDTSHEIKLLGYPWSEDTVKSARLINALFSTLYTLGWILTLNANISKAKECKDTLLFRHQLPAPAPCDWCAISFSRYNKIRLVDAPSELAQSLATKLSNLVMAQKQWGPSVWDIKLLGRAWMTNGRHSTENEWIMLVLVAALEEEGWSVYGSVSHETNPSRADRKGCDVWHICKPVGWVKGAPVFHR